MTLGKYCLAAVVFISNFCFCQINNKSQVINASRNYYRGLKIFSIDVLEKSKPPVAEDTALARFRCLIDNENGIMLFLTSKKNYGILIREAKEYSIDLDSNIYRFTREKDRKFTSYNKRYKFYPFVKIAEFFDKLSSRTLSLTETDMEYVLSNDSYLCEFRKSDFSIKRFVEFGYERKYKGNWYEETNFGECIRNNTVAVNFLEKAVEVVSLTENEKEYWSKKKQIAPTTFDRSVFAKADLRVANYKEAFIEKEFIFLDFFYSSCIPCYKSHPLVNRLHANRDSNFLVIGVDPMLSDTLHIQDFLTRFEIKHPVVIGQDALQISRIPGVVNGYPTFLLIDKNGNILEYQNGHSEKFLRGIEKKYLSKKKT